MKKFLEYRSGYFECMVDAKRVKGGFYFVTYLGRNEICKKHARDIFNSLKREFNLVPFIKKP